jgi:hypothetical protein
MMETADSRSVGFLEHGDGVPLLFGLMISVVLSLGLWVAAWWLGSMIPY